MHNAVVTPMSLENKLFYHGEKVSELLETGDTTPVTWELDPTNLCNHDCIGCYAKGAGGRANNESIGLKEGKNYIDQICELNTKAISFTGGGDPMINKDTPEFIRYSKSKGLDVGMVTNGTIFSDESIDTVIKNNSWIRVSLDAGSDKVYSIIRRVPSPGPAGLDKAIKNLAKLSARKKELNSDCTIGAGFLTSELTNPDMIAATKMCRDAGIDYISFRPFHGDYTIPDDIKKCREMETDSFKVHFSEFKYDSKYTKQYTVCRGQSFSGVINVHKVFVCCHLRGVTKYELGDLRENSLSEIWHSEKRKHIVNNIDFRDCIALCKLDCVNRQLHHIRKKPQHTNFI